MKNYNFWFSKKQSAVLGASGRTEEMPINYAKIDGKHLVYTSCSKTMDHGCKFDDMKYLGQGDYAFSKGTW